MTRLDDDPALLTEFDKDEFRDVARQIDPKLTDEEFERAWAEFIELKQEERQLIEVMHNLFVGGADALIHADDGTNGVKDGWFVVSAAKDPWHREALGARYVGRAAPKDDPEYLFAARDRRLILNLIDGQDPAYVSDHIIVTALDMIHAARAGDVKVLVHCNKGLSRSPTIAMLYMAKHGPLREMLPFEVVQNFKRIYPDYAPADGMRLYAQHWLEEMTKAA